jgi:uncharacterized protein (TIRG00374 family)
MALRMVGIEPDVLSGLSIFVVWVLVLLITAIPITPGGIGIAEMAYIGLFTAVAGDEFSDIIAAGVILFRLVQWALPIPVGWTVVYFWRRQVQQGKLPDPFATPDTDPQAEPS